MFGESAPPYITVANKGCFYKFIPHGNSLYTIQNNYGCPSNKPWGQYVSFDIHKGKARLVVEANDPVLWQIYGSNQKIYGNICCRIYLISINTDRCSIHLVNSNSPSCEGVIRNKWAQQTSALRSFTISKIEKSFKMTNYKMSVGRGNRYLISTKNKHRGKNAVYCLLFLRKKAVLRSNLR